eukprot:Partr_v1_DN28547_c2_g1_i1_m73370 putative MAF-like protein
MNPTMLNTLPPQLAHLEKKIIILATASPRRHEIFARTSLPFTVMPSQFPETLDKTKFETPIEYVLETARRKGQDVKERLLKEKKHADLIISADTIVISGDGKILEKPKDKKECVEMLKSLSGRSHQVVTAMSLSDTSNKLKQRGFFELTRVRFGTLSEEEIDWYISTGEPFDKAGGYGYQSLGMAFVERIEGCYYNVVGLPFHRCISEMAKVGLL